MYFIHSRIKTLETVYKRWFSEYAETNLRPRTRKTYEYVSRSIIIPKLGHIKLNRIDRYVIETFFNSVSHYSVNYRKTILLVLKAILKWAIYPCKYIRINPLDYISPDFAKSPRKAKRDENCFLTKDIIDLFFKEYPEYDPIGLAARISYWTALREGEVCGLTWDSVDLDKRVIYVENTICRNPYKNFGWEFTRPKTPASIAPVTFSSKLEHVLRHKKELQDIRRSENLYLKYHIEEGLVSLAGNEKETLPFVCTDTFGRFLKPSQVILECNKFSKKYATHLNFHMFRHTHATYLHEKGIDIKEIQHRLRHKNASTTINIYTHSTRALQAEALKVVEEM